MDSFVRAFAASWAIQPTSFWQLQCHLPFRVTVRLGVLAGVVWCAAPAGVSQEFTRIDPGQGASVVGRVVDGSTESAPISNASVTLLDATLQRPVQSTVTDENGAFEFADITPGRYEISATRIGFLEGRYGADRSGLIGLIITVDNRNERRLILIKLQKASEIRGFIKTSFGGHAPKVSVFAVRPSERLGTSGPLRSVKNATTMTDDRGSYRLSGLSAGRYILVAVAPNIGVAIDNDNPRGEVHSTTEGNSGTNRLAYAPLYYPDSIEASTAAHLVLAPGQILDGIDFHLTPVKIHRLAGRVIETTGGGVTDAIVNIAPAGLGGVGKRVVRAATDGTFAVTGLTSGEYLLTVTASTSSAGSPQAEGSGRSSSLHGSATVRVDGDLADLQLFLHPSATLTGHVVFKSSLSKTTATPLRLLLRLVRSENEASNSLFVTRPAPDGRFVFHDIPQGTYRLAAILDAGFTGERWGMVSVSLDSTDVTDRWFVIREGQRSGITVVFDPNALGDVLGVVRSSNAALTDDCLVVLAATNKVYWGADSRRIRIVRPDAEGRYYIPGVPPGEYSLRATRIEIGRGIESAVLDALSGIRFTVGAAETLSQDLTASSCQEFSGERER